MKGVKRNGRVDVVIMDGKGKLRSGEKLRPQFSATDTVGCIPYDL